MEPLLRDWFSPTAADTALHVPDNLSASSIISLKAEHIEAHRTGHAFSFASHDWNWFQDDLDLSLVAYADGIMAWVDTTDSHAVKSLDLKTGKRWSFLPEDRTNVLAIATSSSIVAAFGSGRCRVWSLTTGDRYSLRLPSASLSSIAASGGSLAFVFPSGSRKPSFRFEVVTWALKDQRTSSFFVASSSKRGKLDYPLKIMLDNRGESVLLFERVRNQSQDDGLMHLHYIRTSLNGDILIQGVIDIPGMEDYYFMDDTVPKEANEQAVIWSLSKRQPGVGGFSKLMLICYNFREDRPEFRTQLVKGLCINTETTSDLFCWKDTAYFLEKENNVPCWGVIDLQESTCSKAKMEFPVNILYWGLPRHLYGVPEIMPFGDETFLVYAFVAGFYVWCFDANVQLFNEDINFKERRKSNIEKRLLLKQERKNVSSSDSSTRKLD